MLIPLFPAPFIQHWDSNSGLIWDANPPNLIHLRFLSWGWLRRLFFSPWRSSTLPKPQTAMGTNAQVIIYYQCRIPTKTVSSFSSKTAISSKTNTGTIYLYFSKQVWLSPEEISNEQPLKRFLLIPAAPSLRFPHQVTNPAPYKGSWSWHSNKRERGSLPLCNQRRNNLSGLRWEGHPKRLHLLAARSSWMGTLCRLEVIEQ